MGTGKIRIGPEINVGSILSILTVLVAVIGSYFAIDSRVKAVETQNAELLRVLERQFTRFEDLRQELIVMKIALARLEARDAISEQNGKTGKAR